MNGNGGGITKAQMEEIMSKQTANAQVIRIEQAPLVISAVEPNAKTDTNGTSKTDI